MAYAKKFEDLEVWKRSRALTKSIYNISSNSNFSIDYGLKDQIRRASVSVMSNIAEGFDRGNKGDFHRFLSIAKASCAEVQSQLYVALDVHYITQDDFDKLQQQAKQLGYMLGSLRNKVYEQWQSGKQP